MFTSQNKLSNAFRFKDYLPKKIKAGVVYKTQCGQCNNYYYGECVRHLHIRIGEYIPIFPLTKKKINLRVVLLVITCYFLIIHKLLKVLWC